MSSLTLHQFLQRITPGLDGRMLVIFLDQFEDVFIRFAPEARTRFFDELARCYDDDHLPVKFVISLRKDYFSDLYELKSAIPTVFHNGFKLDPLTPEQAVEAICKPLESLTHVRYEPALVDLLIEELSLKEHRWDGVSPPQLQIVCHSLYEVRHRDTITVEDYKRLGGAAGILATYLNHVMQTLKRQHRPIAKSVLIALITDEGTKQSLSKEELDAKVQAITLDIDTVVAQLIKEKLIIQDEDLGELQYELAHDYLIKEISNWISDEQWKIKEIQELLNRELANYRIFGTLINPDNLHVIEKWYGDDRISYLSQEAQTLITLSRQKQAEQEQSHIQLIQTVKMTSIDQLILGIGHECNTPIASTLSNSRYLSRSVARIMNCLEKILSNEKNANSELNGDVEAWNQYVEKRLREAGVWKILHQIELVADELGEAASKMSDLIGALRSFVQPGHGQFRPTDIRTSLDAALLLLGYKLAYTASVKRQYGETNLQVNGSSNQLIQMFMNILMNSVEAIEQDEGRQGMIQVNAYPEDVSCIVIIHDNGGGIPPEYRQQIPQFGFTTKKAPHRGFGLSIAMQIAQRHQGSLEIVDDDQEGVAVKISLPLTH